MSSFCVRLAAGTTSLLLAVFATGCGSGSGGTDLGSGDAVPDSRGDEDIHFADNNSLAEVNDVLHDMAVEDALDDEGSADTPRPDSGPECGDGQCGVGEDCETCAADCGVCVECGDGVCDSSEGCGDCSQDCGSCPSECGNGFCEPDELCSNCSEDCGPCQPSCGDGECNGLESCESCDADCGTCPVTCPNGSCEQDEDCQICPADCGSCPPICGDDFCQAPENCTSCTADCGPCQPVCGDDECEGAESCAMCTEDCGACPNPCGDGFCLSSGGENCASCPDDCGACPFCGDQECQSEEDCFNCPLDCECVEVCGDQMCHGSETCDSCLPDCGPCFVCGDTQCNGSETCETCVADCGACPPSCGDNACNGDETCSDCPADCGACPAECGNSACDADETCENCEADCGKCPPLLWFNQWWEERLTGGPIVAGRKLKLRYDLERLPQCRSTHNGYPGWTITLYYSFDLSQPAKEVQAVWHDSFTHQSFPAEPVIEIPSTAQNVWFWASNTDVQGCVAWDSDFGLNYLHPVFNEETISQDIGWSGNFNFVFYTEAGASLKGDVDPAYYFSSFGGSELATWVQAEVWVPGITDRTYQNNEIARQVALNAVKPVVRTDAFYPGGQPGAEKQDLALEFVGRDGNNFVYRWFPPMYVGWGNNIPEGAYSYFLRFSTAEGSDVDVFERPGKPGEPRTMVLGINVNCSLFPYNPPSSYCQ